MFNESILGVSQMLYGCFMIFYCIFMHISVSGEFNGSIMVISCVFHGWFMDVSYYFIVVL